MTPQTKTLSVPEAGRFYFGIGRNASYERARDGTLPTIRIGRLLRVPIVAMDRMMEEAGAQTHPVSVRNETRVAVQ